VWQQLQDSLADEAFTVIAVAEESGGAAAARPWIEQASPSYPCLIDTNHLVSARYGMVNVPQSVWIDVDGHIARPPESAGATDHFRRMDLATRTMAPDDQRARQAARTAYMNAVRDWVRTGHYALDADAARHGLPAITADIALAETHFRLGLWLQRNGRASEAAPHFAEASRLHPNSWTIWRQAAELREPGGAASPAFWARVLALGDTPYYPPPNLLLTPPAG